MRLARRGVLTGMGALALLPGCGALTAISDATAVLDAYELRAPRLPQATRMLSRGLSIEPPTASGALDVDRILIRPNPVQSQYLPGARWSEDMPRMVQSLMLRSFEETGALAYVGRRPLGGTGDVALISEITDFQAELEGDSDATLVRVRMIARMVRESDARVLGRQAVQGLVPAASTDTLEIVEAFDLAVDEMLDALVRWGLEVMGTRLPTA